jgi:uncharacterized protein YceK
MNRIATCAVCVCLGLCGCGTLDNVLPHGQQNMQVYGGVRQDLKTAAESSKTAVRAKSLPEFADAAGTGTLSILDTPLSAVGDTVTLPWTASKAIKSSSK